MFYTYVLQSEKDENERYIGYTIDLRKRLVEHNAGNSEYSKRHIPWKLIYYEACLNQDDAERREKYLKTTHGRRMLKRRLKGYFSLNY